MFSSKNLNAWTKAKMRKGEGEKGRKEEETRRKEWSRKNVIFNLAAKDDAEDRIQPLSVMEENSDII